MIKYVSERTRWPADGGHYPQGRVTVRFIVTKEGKIKEAKVIKGLTPYCDEKALEIIHSMPDWIPGRHNGKNVDVYYTIPVIYRLRN